MADNARSINPVDQLVPRSAPRHPRNNVIHLGPSPTFKALVFCLGWAGALLCYMGHLAHLV